MKNPDPKLYPSRNNLGYILFLLDTSQSMATQITGMPASEQESMVEYASTVLNHVFTSLIHTNRDGNDVIIDRVFVGLITYGTPRVPSVLPDETSDSDVVTVCEGTLSKLEPVLEPYQARVTTPEGSTECLLYRLVPRLATVGGPRGTPMAEAFEIAAERVKTYLESRFGDGPIPVVVNITDGEPTDEVRARAAAAALTNMGNKQGNVLLYNIHITSTFQCGKSDDFPTKAPNDPSGKFLFDISSVIPEFMREHFESQGYKTPVGARGCKVNQGISTLMKLVPVLSVLKPGGDAVGR